MSSLDGSDTNFNPLTLDGEPIATSSTDVIGLISTNALLLDCSNVPLTGLLTVNHNPSISVNGGTYLHSTYINGNASISGDVSVVGNVYVSNNVVTFGNLDGHNVYGDYLEVGADETSLGVLIYNKMSINGPIILGKDISVANNVIAQNISVSGITRSHTISANTYYNLPITPAFDGNLNGNISVSGTSTFKGISYFKDTTYHNASVVFNQPIGGGNTQIFGKGMSFDVSDLPYPNGTIIGGKQYSGKELLMLDNSTYFAGSVTRISISELYKINQNISINGTEYINGSSSISGTLNSNTILTPSASVSSIYVGTNTTNTNSVWRGTNSNLVFRNVTSGILGTGGCFMNHDYYKGAWTTGIWFNNCIYKANIDTVCQFSITVTWWSTAPPGLVSLNCDIYAPGMVLALTKYTYKFFNIGSNHESHTFNFTTSTNLGFLTGYFSMYVYASGAGITSDVNDTITWSAICLG